MQLPEKEEHFAVRQLNRNPNELVSGSEVRPQPPHCDKNSYVLNHLLSSVAGDNKIVGRKRQPLFCGVEQQPERRMQMLRSRKNQMAPAINPPRVFDPKEICQLAVVIAVVNHEIGNLPCFE